MSSGLGEAEIEWVSVSYCSSTFQKDLTFHIYSWISTLSMATTIAGGSYHINTSINILLLNLPEVPLNLQYSSQPSQTQIRPAILEITSSQHPSLCSEPGIYLPSPTALQIPSSQLTRRNLKNNYIIIPSTLKGLTKKYILCFVDREQTFSCISPNLSFACILYPASCIRMRGTSRV